MSVAPDLVVGAVLTAAGWLGLLIAVVHSRRVIGRLTDSTPNRRGERPDDAETDDDE